ncbi:MAG: replication factor C large subunit [Candidatus ainarchaeum sp.]|nr:replication factor C large subunit [Candidatus ainarchaeum sp.]
MLLAQKYSPRKVDDLAGNDEAKRVIKQWILNWMRGVKQRPLLINGPTGIGKTSIAYALRQEFDLELVEMNASDLRDANSIGRVLSSAGTASSLSGKTKLLLIDDVDALQGKDRGGASAIVSMLKSAQVPVMLTASDVWDRKLSGIKAGCQLLDLRRISKSSVKKVLKSIAEAEKLEIPETFLDSIAENCNGDLRSAINDMQAGMNNPRDRERDIFERMKTIFKSTTYSQAREAGWGDVEHDFLKLWIDENIPLEYEYREEVALAYDNLSRADVFDGRIMNRQYWGFLRYSGDLITAGVALSKNEKYFKFVRYQFPNYLRQMSSSMARRAMLKAVGHKIGVHTHTGWKDSLEYIHIMQHILDRNPEAMWFYQLEEDQVAFILGVSVSDLKEKFSPREEIPEEKETSEAKKDEEKEKKPEKKNEEKEKEKPEVKKQGKEKEEKKAKKEKEPKSGKKDAKRGTLSDFL